jgi:hypothetical protein
MDVVVVTCPYCFESMELELEADERGEMVQDCDVCCQPWLVVVTRDAEGFVSVRVDRAQ